MRKALKISGYSLLGIIIVAYIFLFIAFNSYEPDRIKIDVSEKALGYFNETYEECRSDFLKVHAQLEEKFDGVKYLKFTVPSETVQNLYTDISYVPAQDTTLNLLILTSGIHGLEGFTGSAVQLMAVKEMILNNFFRNL